MLYGNAVFIIEVILKGLGIEQITQQGDQIMNSVLITCNHF